MAKYYDIPDTMRYVIEVPDDLKGRVIGKRGRQLKAIESETGVKMKIVPSGAVLEGSEEAIEKAKEVIQSIIATATGNVPRYTDTMRCVVEVPEDQKGRVVGRGGGQLKSIESETGVKMKMEPSGAVLEGSEEAIEKAKEMIQSIITGKVPRYTDTMSCVVKVPEDQKGRIIGRGGRQLKAIESETGVIINMNVEPSGAVLEGSEEAIEKAKEMIQSIIRPYMVKKTIPFPMKSFGSVLGTGGLTLQSIQHQTNTKIWLDQEGDVDTAFAHISGANEEQCRDAEQKILKLALMSPKLFERFAFVDDAYVSDENEFTLENCQDVFKKPTYKLTMDGDQLLEPKEVDYLPLLKKSLLEVLREIHKENEESKNLRTDMWCHFGHAYICNVDEDDVGQVYEIAEVKENLLKKEDMWKVVFKEGLETLELNQLERALSKQPYKVKPNIRYDYTFLCPSGRQVRVKAYAFQSNSYPDGVSYQKYESPIPLKNVLADLSTESIECRLCAPHKYHLKVDIFIPYLKLDCHLVIRTNLRDTSTVRDEEEDQILIAFLNDSLKLGEGKLELHGDIPDGFIITYKRVCKRRTYPYTSNNVDFNVTISEEESQELASEKNVRTKTDIHLHCDEWDQLLDQEDWEPEAIVSKLPDFLHFVRDVQSNIK